IINCSRQPVCDGYHKCRKIFEPPARRCLTTGRGLSPAPFSRGGADDQATKRYCVTPSTMYATPGLVTLARKGCRSFQPGESRQACAFSTLSKAVTITRFGASPSSGVTFPPRTRYFPPNACIVAGTFDEKSLKAAWSVTSVCVMTYAGGLA